MATPFLSLAALPPYPSLWLADADTHLSEPAPNSPSRCPNQAAVAPIGLSKGAWEATNGATTPRCLVLDIDSTPHLKGGQTNQLSTAASTGCAVLHDRGTYEVGRTSPQQQALYALPTLPAPLARDPQIGSVELCNCGKPTASARVPMCCREGSQAWRLRALYSQFCCRASGCTPRPNQEARPGPGAQSC